MNFFFYQFCFDSYNFLLKLIYLFIFVLGNQSCFRYRFRCSTFKWAVGDDPGRYKLHIFMFMYPSAYLLSIEAFTLVIDFFLIMLHRVILFSNLFFLEKWVSHF
jgi:hypothetical protein